jgi:hypothetical protein
MRFVPAVAPALAPVGRERLAHGYDDHTRRDDEGRRAPTARRITDDDTSGNGNEQQRSDEKALHDRLSV